MASVVPCASSILPRLPIEVWESVIDILAGYYDGFHPLESKARRDVNTCRLVCRAWVPRCRLHLYNEIFLDSRDGLQATSNFLQHSTFHTSRVYALQIRGTGPDQSWIATVPLRLPPLRNLAHIFLIGVDFAQQPPHFYQIYSLLRTRSQNSGFALHVDEDHLTAKPNRIATLAAALHFPIVHANPYAVYPLDTPAQVARIFSWPQKLRNCTALETRGSLWHLLQVLSPWSRPVKHWRIAPQLTRSTLEALGVFWPDMRIIWEDVSRVFTLSVAQRPGDVFIRFHLDRLGDLILRSFICKCVFPCILRRADLIVPQTMDL